MLDKWKKHIKGTYMKYNFDTPTDRRHSRSIKWDVLENELPMWIADMDFETAPMVKDALIETANHGIFGYSTTPQEYFEAISDFFFDRHHYRFMPKDMIFTSGILASIASMIRSLTEPSDKVLLQSPVYNNFYDCIKNNGREVIESELVYKNGEYSIDFVDLEEKLSQSDVKLMIICNPHNPIGKVWERKELSKIAELCKKHSVTVISDEIHCSLTPCCVKYTPFASASESAAEISATCVSTSKTFNLAGIHAAVVIARNEQINKKVALGIKRDELSKPNIFAINGCIAGYRYGNEWLDELNEYLCANRRFAEEYINKNIKGLYVVNSNASYLLWVDISKYSNDSVSFTSELREKTGLYVSPGAVYGTGGEGFIRINLGTQRARVEDGLYRLKSFIESL